MNNDRCRVCNAFLEQSPKLTDRQVECVILVGRGHTEREISKRLGISTETVKSHLREARRAYAVTKTIQLVIALLHRGEIATRDMIVS